MRHPGWVIVGVAVLGVGAWWLYTSKWSPKPLANAGPSGGSLQPMPVLSKVNPAPFAQPSLAYAPGASPLLTQIGQGVQVGQSVVGIAKSLGFFDYSSDDGDGA
jgi:hypothetical protein